MEFHTLLKHHSVLFHNKETNKELYAQKLDLSRLSVCDVHSPLPNVQVTVCN